MLCMWYKYDKDADKHVQNMAYGIGNQCLVLIGVHSVWNEFYPLYNLYV